MKMNKLVPFALVMVVLAAPTSPSAHHSAAQQPDLSATHIKAMVEELRQMPALPTFEAYPIRTQADLTDAMLMLSTYTFKPFRAKYAPEHFTVRLDTSKGPIMIAVHSDWAPIGAQRFYELVRSHYYDGARFFRIRAGTWAQFGIAGDPNVARKWRQKTIRDDEFEGISNKRGTVAFAFKDPNGRTTQVFINLKDNAATHDKEPFVVFGEVVQGMDVADKFYAGYGEAAGGGIRAGRQDPVFDGGNKYLEKNFPRLDYIKTARVLPR